MAMSNTGIVRDPDAPRYSRGARFNQRNKQKLIDGIRVGLHPEVAAARAGWLPEEFEELIGANEKFRRMILKEYAQYEYNRAEQVHTDVSSKMAIAYLERCRKHWAKKVDVSLAPLAKKAMDRLEKELRGRKQISGEEAWDMVLDAFAAEGAKELF